MTLTSRPPEMGHSWVAGPFEMVCAPQFGAGIVSLSWRDPTGRVHQLLQSGAEEALARRHHSGLGMFLMAPFCNRINGGRFQHEGCEIALPINRPERGAAIHGFVRDAPSDVEADDAGALVLVQRECGSGPYRHTSRLEIRLAGESLKFTLTIEATGTEPLPYGLGFHPWFRAEENMSLCFSASHLAVRDELGLPASFERVSGGPGAGHPTTPLDVPEDKHFSGWDGRARIVWAETGIGLDILACDTLQNLHVYVPPDRSALCVEPVSHLPDVVNRRELATFGDMTSLAPGQKMSATMSLAPFAGKGS
jgi:aldose 1-epimerase